MHFFAGDEEVPIDSSPGFAERVRVQDSRNGKLNNVCRIDVVKLDVGDSEQIRRIRRSARHPDSIRVNDRAQRCNRRGPALRNR